MTNLPAFVTDELVRASIASWCVWNPDNAPTMTVASVVLHNGWTLIGHDAPMNPESFDPEKGMEFALGDALEKAKPFLAFGLRQRAYEADVAAGIAAEPPVLVLEEPQPEPLSVAELELLDGLLAKTRRHAGPARWGAVLEGSDTIDLPALMVAAMATQGVTVTRDRLVQPILAILEEQRRAFA